MSENEQPGGLTATDDALGYLDRIARAVEIQDPRGGRSVDSDFVWSVVVPPVNGWPLNPLVDWFVNPANRWFDASQPNYMVPIDLPNDQKLPYVVIQGGRRSVELVDDMTGLVVLAAGPGQIMSGNVGESSSFRAIVGPGPTSERIAVRFSARPIGVFMPGQTSGLIPVIADQIVAGSGIQAYGWFRNPTGARALYVYIRAVITDATTNLNLQMTGPMVSPTGNGVAVIPVVNVTPGVTEYRARFDTMNANAVPGVTPKANPPGREFGFFLQISPGTSAIYSLNLSYELIY